MTRGVLLSALRGALRAFPPSPIEATTALEERGFVATCSEVKHIVSHTLYHVKCDGEDYVVKVPKE